MYIWGTEAEPLEISKLRHRKELDYMPKINLNAIMAEISNHAKGEKARSYGEPTAEFYATEGIRLRDMAESHYCWKTEAEKTENSITARFICKPLAAGEKAEKGWHEFRAGVESVIKNSVSSQFYTLISEAEPSNIRNERCAYLPLTEENGEYKAEITLTLTD